MWERLDSIPWQDLRHACGAAEDVPGLLRALAESESERHEALSELFTKIWHQGTVYEASAYAVPFLIQLAARPELDGRPDILGLIGALAEGQSYLAVHATHDEFGRRERERPDFQENLARELGHVARVAEAIAAAREVLRRLLLDPSPMVRASALYVLSRPAIADAETLKVALEATRREGDRLARAAMLWALGSFGDKGRPVLDLLEAEAQGAGDPRIRVGAALALYQLLGSYPPGAREICALMAAATWFAEAFLAGAMRKTPRSRRSRSVSARYSRRIAAPSECATRMTGSTGSPSVLSSRAIAFFQAMGSGSSSPGIRG